MDPLPVRHPWSRNSRAIQSYARMSSKEREKPNSPTGRHPTFGVLRKATPACTSRILP